MVPTGLIKIHEELLEKQSHDLCSSDGFLSGEKQAHPAVPNFPLAESRQPPHNHIPWKGARTSTLLSSQQGCPIRAECSEAHLTLLMEEKATCSSWPGHREGICSHSDGTRPGLQQEAYYGMDRHRCRVDDNSVSHS